MKKFEYFIADDLEESVKCYNRFIADDLRIDLKHPRVLEQELNRLGNNGWELTYVIPVGEAVDMFLFKREVI